MLLENSSFPHDDRVRREARTLTLAGHKITVLCPASAHQSSHEMFEGIRVYRYPFPQAGSGFISYVWEYTYSIAAIFLLSLFALARDGFDVVHAHQPPDLFVFIAGFYKLLRKKYVLDHHDLAPELYFARFRGNGNSSLYQFLLWLEGRSFRLADQIISTNESYKKIAMQRGLVKEGRITVVRNGPDLGELRSSEIAPNLRDAGKTVIGYVGVIGIQDGVDNLLRAIQHLVYELHRRDFSCVIVGDGIALQGLRALKDQLEIAPYVNFIGWVDSQAEVAKYLNAMDICVAPEPSDPYNDRSTAAKIMEYMALGKPIVSFDLPEHRFTAQDAAVYARPGDAVDFADKIVELMNDPKRRAGMSKAGIMRIESELAWSHQAVKLLTAYEKLGSNS